MHRPPEKPAPLAGDNAAEEVGPSDTVRDATATDWQRENSRALASSNDRFDRNGLPLARHRPF
jgi:antitoxin CcdA